MVLTVHEMKPFLAGLMSWGSNLFAPAARPCVVHRLGRVSHLATLATFLRDIILLYNKLEAPSRLEVEVTVNSPFLVCYVPT